MTLAAVAIMEVFAVQNIFAILASVAFTVQVVSFVVACYKSIDVGF